MKRKIKRKLFLMGMTLAAGLPGGAFAKESGKAAYQAYLRASQWQSAAATAPAEEGSLRDVGKLKAIVWRMNDAFPAPDAHAKARNWRLEMLQADVPADQADTPQANGDRFVGVGLRIDF